MKTEVSYGSFSFESKNGYPVPNFTLSIENNRATAGDYLSSEMVVTLEGVVYTQKMKDMSSTNSSDVGTTSVTELFNKASGLKSSIMSNNGKICTIKCGSTSIVASTGILKNISFKENENHWAYTIDYVIEIGIPWVSKNNWSNLTKDKHYHVSNVQDEYRLEVIDDQMYFYNNQYLPTYRISRTLGATGKSFDSSSGSLVYAKQWVKERELVAPLTGIFKPLDFPLYNQTRNISVNEVDGTYTITDTFISKSGNPWIETRSINTSIDASLTRQIEINGKIQGLQPANVSYAPTSSISGQQDLYPLITGISNYKYQNAVSGYSGLANQFYGIAKTYDNLSFSNWHGSNISDFDNIFTRTLNPIPLSSTEGLNPTEGSISYSRTYNSRPLSLISGAISETLSIRESKPTYATSPIFVIGRRLGPVLTTNTFASGIGVKTVSYEAVFPRPTGLKGYSFPRTIRNDINRFVSGLKPQQEPSFIKEDSETLNLTENRLSRTISWEYTSCN